MPKIPSWNDKVLPVFAEGTQPQKTFSEFLRAHHAARSALAKLQSAENDRITISFLLLRCAGQPAKETTHGIEISQTDVEQIKKKACWLAEKMAQIYAWYCYGEVDTDPLLLFLECKGGYPGGDPEWIGPRGSERAVRKKANVR